MLDEPLEAYELYVTTCRKSFRKSLSKDYKAKRQRNSYVPVIRSHYLLFKDAVDDDELEADDLISLRAKELGVGNYIVVSTDKDLKQIGGHYWSYYREVGKTDEFGVKIAPFKQKEIMFITEDEADYLFWTQMLTGDSVDGIQGLKGVGAARAKKILDRDGANWMTVMREYISRGAKDEFLTNYQLLKLKEEL